MTILVRNNCLEHLILTYIIICFIQGSLLEFDHLFVAVLPVSCLELPDTQLRHQRHPKEPLSTKIGLLKCVARSVVPIQRENESSREERKNASTDVSTNASGSSNGPHIIFLPPIEESKAEEDSNPDREHEAREVHLDPEDQQELLSEATNDQYEDYETYDTKKKEGQDFAPTGNETMNHNRHPARPSSRATVKFDRAPKGRPSLWTLLERPLSKLVPNQRQRHDGGLLKLYDRPIPSKKRLKRQTNVDLTEQLIRALTPNGISLGDQVSSNSRNLLQQVLVSMNLLAQQLLSLLIRQTTADLPAHMANLGKLASNLITALTLDNPLLINSPILLRTQQSGLNLDALSRQNSSLLLTTTQQLLANMGRLIREMAINSANQGTTATQPSVSRITTSTAGSVEPTGRVEAEDRDVAFVRRLNELTLGITRPESINGSSTGAVRPRREVKSALSLRPSSSHRGGRSKRSIGSLLMFGPFSKFYLAMMMNRVIKYQSGVFSQAVMGELVKRFVLPGVTSAFDVNKPLGLADVSSNLLQQLKQSLSGAQVNSGLQQNHSSLSEKKPATEALRLTESNSVEEQEKAANEQRASAVTFDADCQLVSPQSEHQSPTHLPDPQSLLHPFAAPAGLMAAAISNPAISLDKQGLSFRLPSSQTRVTIPNLLNGEQSIQSLLRAFNPALLNGSQAEGPFGGPMTPLTLPANFSHQQIVTPHFLKNNAFNPARLYGNPSQRAPLYTSGGSELAQLPPGAKNQDELVSKLLDHVATTTKTTALLLEAHLKQASPRQLLELLAQANAQQRVQQLSRGASVGSRPDIGSILGAMQHLNNSSTRDDTTSGHNFHSVNFLADKILNKTLSMSLGRLLAGNDASKSSPEQSDRLLKETSDLLADSFAQLIKGEFERGKTNREKVGEGILSRSQDKMATDHANLVIGKLLALSRNATSNSDSDWSTMPSLESDWQTSAPLLSNNQIDERDQRQFGDWSIQAAGSEANQFDPSSNPANESSPSDSMSNNDLAIKELIQQELDRAGLGERQMGIVKPITMLSHPMGKVAREELNEPAASGGPPGTWREGSRVYPHGMDRENYNRSSIGQSVPLLGGFRPLGSRVTKLRQQSQPLKQASSSQSDNIVVAGPPGGPFIQPPISPLSSKLSSPGDSQLTRSGNTVLQQQQRHNTLSAPTKGQAEHEFRLGDKTSFSSSNQARLAANNRSRQISSGREEPSSGNLNNLAMALNVMNMVLLNQKLANGSATPTGGVWNNDGTTVQAPAIGHLFVHQLDPPTGGKTKPTKTVGVHGIAGNLLHEAGRGEREGQAAKQPAQADKSEGNHRTSSNTIRQNATLLLTPNGSTTRRKQSSKIAGNRPASYLFQPLVISKNNTGSSPLNATSTNQVGKQMNTSFDEPEKDHAVRWNDVLQNISLAS